MEILANNNTSHEVFQTQLKRKNIKAKMTLFRKKIGKVPKNGYNRNINDTKMRGIV